MILPVVERIKKSHPSGEFSCVTALSGIDNLYYQENRVREFDDNNQEKS